MKLRAWVLVMSLVGAAPYGVAAADQNLSAQQAEAEKQRLALQKRIGQLQKNIESTQSSQQNAAAALRDVETRISTTDNELNQLVERQQQVEAYIKDLNKQVQAQQQKQEQGQEQLAEQLRAQYASGLSPWTALLSGNDPQQIQRELGYLAYVSKAQTDQVRVLQQGLKHLEQLHAAEQANQKELVQLTTAAQKQREQLAQQQAERETVLAKVENELKEQQQQAKTLAANDQRLGNLITGLEKEIAHQAELRRQAEARRKAEEARRKAEEERRLAEEKRRKEEAQRLAQEQQRQAQLQAEREAEEKRLYALAHTPAQPAEKTTPPPPVERLVVPPPEPPEPPPPPPPPPPAPVKVAPKPPPVTEPSGGFSGLSKGLQPPVRGEVQGRFGTPRPEGGPWRGIVLRTAAGTPVNAIAAGRVVFSNWMEGFGNLLIIDHGAGYLSVYGHNQSVLKQVGDVVSVGEAVARVGATGGQLEPGVYFEIRQNGQPVNPQLWLRN